ncbi:MAG: excinuclease ABC subunit UvrC [Ruminococcaceae bacterium]|nr:excinuclease ABC subunit UvrC [Oscillospiraceae bacterium]
MPISGNPKLAEHREKLKLVPKKPGVYLMKNRDDRVIYVGKAKSLWNRLSQYFGGSPKDLKTMQMVLHVDHFDYIITDSEKDAFLLENNLIKKYKPKYNILLKDDKTYPFIKIEKKTVYPYLSLVRKTERDANKYYGPYLNAQVVNGAIDLISKEYKLRTCHADLTKEKKRPCLNYHMGYCSAPCTRMVSCEEYDHQLKEAIHALDSGLKSLIPVLAKKMEACVENLDFEGAAKYRDNIRLAEKFAEKHQVVTVKKVNLDVLYCYRDGEISAISVLTVKDGIIHDKKSYTFPDSRDVSDEDMIASFLKQFYLARDTITKRIVISINTDYQIPYEELSKQMEELFQEGITVSRGRGKFTKNLIEMARVNAIEAIKLRLKTKIDDQLFLLKEFVGLEQAPLRIESYDNSNTAGSNAVGVMTVYENGVLSQKEKRTFGIKNHNGSDDYAAMYEVLDRRIYHLTNSDKGFEVAPDLILVDGGKGQVKCAKEVLLKYGFSIPVFGMVKDDKHRLKDLTDGYRLLDLKSNKALFVFLSKINEQTHKNAISYHKKKNTLTATQSELLTIPKVGMATIKKLYGHFKTLKQIKEATLEELQKALPFGVALNIYQYFHNEENESH